MPMMVGMMVCAVVVVCVAENHNVDSHVEYFLYPTFSPGVNELRYGDRVLAARSGAPTEGRPYNFVKLGHYAIGEGDCGALGG
jgi:hypothetical protein